MIDIVQDVLQGLTASQQDQAVIREIIGQLIALSAKSRSEYSASFESKVFQVELAATLDAVLQKITVDSFISVTQDLLSRQQAAVSLAMSSTSRQFLLTKFPLRPAARRSCLGSCRRASTSDQKRPADQPQRRHDPDPAGCIRDPRSHGSVASSIGYPSDQRDHKDRRRHGGRCGCSGDYAAC